MDLLTCLLAYGIAYSYAPINMRGLVSAINLFNTAIAYIVNLACSSVVADPHLTWDFGGPAIVGGITTVVFVSGPRYTKPLCFLRVEIARSLTNY